jgi:hypothetical protein
MGDPFGPNWKPFGCCIHPPDIALNHLSGYWQGSSAQLGSVTEDELKTWVEVGQPKADLNLMNAK